MNVIPGPPIPKATVTCPDTEITTIIETQNGIVKAAAESNCCCQFKIEGTAFKTSHLLPEFGYCVNNKEYVDDLLD